YVSFDNTSTAITLFTASVWGLGEVTNGKIYQSVNLQPGKYRFRIDVGKRSGPVDIFAVVNENTELPDVTAVKSSPSVLTYVNLDLYQEKTAELMFTVTDAGPVRIGIVYTTRSQYSDTAIPWTSFGLNGFALAKLAE